MKRIELDNQLPDITPTNISDVEARYDFLFPEELKDFLLEHNGGTPNDCNIFHTEMNDYVLDFFLPIKYGEDMGFEATLDDLKHIIPAEKVPFALDPFGNLFLFDKKSYHIYFLDMEDSQSTFLSSDAKSEVR